MNCSKKKRLTLFSIAIIVIGLFLSFILSLVLAGLIIENNRQTENVFYDYLRAYKNRDVQALAATLYPQDSQERINYINSHYPEHIPSITALDNAVNYDFQRLWKRAKTEKAHVNIEFINLQGKTEYKKIGIVFEKQNNNWFLSSDLFVYEFETESPPTNNEPDERQKEPLFLNDSTITHYDVKDTDLIEWGSFSEAPNLLSVSFPASYEEFSPFWFSNNKKLYHIDITHGNRFFSSIDGVVYNKDKTKLIYYPRGKISAEGHSLGEFTVPNTVQVVGREAFYNNTGLKKIVFSSSVRQIESESFHYCFNLEEVILNEGLVKIGTKAFTMSAKLSSITIPSTVEEIGADCFFNSAMLTTVKFSSPSSLELLGEGAFSECIRLIEINLPDSLEKIENWTFENCSSLELISLPENLNFIGVAAFENCLSLEELHLSSQISVVRRKAFNNCPELRLYINHDKSPSGWAVDWDFGLSKTPVWGSNN